MDVEEWQNEPNSEGYWWHYGWTWTNPKFGPLLRLRYVRQIQRAPYAPMSFVEGIDGQGDDCKDIYWGKWMKTTVTIPMSLPNIKSPGDLMKEQGRKVDNE